MNKTINFLFGTAGTAGTMEAIEVFPAGPDEINSLVLVVVKALVSILGGVLTTKVMELLKKKDKKFCIRAPENQMLNQLKTISHGKITCRHQRKLMCRRVPCFIVTWQWPVFIMKWWPIVSISEK